MEIVKFEKFLDMYIHIWFNKTFTPEILELLNFTLQKNYFKMPNKTEISSVNAITGVEFDIIKYWFKTQIKC